jgi:glucose/mannose-6-phosphate isomerase
MRKNIIDFPKQFKEGLSLAKNFKIAGQFDNIIISGMGGSAWPVEIITAWLNLNIPIYLNRNYNLPLQFNSKTLAIFVSYSGNTEECLSAYQEAFDKKAKIVIITSGGQLQKIASENNLPIIEIPTGLVPRMATGYIFTALYSILKNANLSENKDDEIIEMSHCLKPLDQEKLGEELAEKIAGKIPLIYTSDRLKVLGYIWKIKFNENSKFPSFCHHFPELNHNEMEGMANEKKCEFHNESHFHTIILKDSNDHPRIQKRMDLTAKLLNKTNLPTEIINLKGKNLLEKIFASILLADWTSYFLAEKIGANPLQTKIIEEFKEEMK